VTDMGFTVPRYPEFPAPPEASGTIDVDCRDLPVPLGFRPLFRPRILIDGWQRPARWGVNTLSVPAGRHDVEVFAMGNGSGRAATSVTVHPGRSTGLEYRAPFVRFSRGPLGPPPQSHNGGRALLLILLLLALASVLCFGGLVVTSPNGH